MTITANPSRILPKNSPFWEGFGVKQPSLPCFGESFRILPKAFGKDFSRRKSRNNNKNHTLSPIKNKSFPNKKPACRFFARVSPWEGFLGKDSPDDALRNIRSRLPIAPNRHQQPKGLSYETRLLVLSLLLRPKSASRSRNECRRHTPVAVVATRSIATRRLASRPARSLVRRVPQTGDDPFARGPHYRFQDHVMSNGICIRA